MEGPRVKREVHAIIKLTEGQYEVLQKLCEAFDDSPPEFVKYCLLEMLASLPEVYFPENFREMRAEVRGRKKE
jgi:hypothetical protein